MAPTHTTRRPSRLETLIAQTITADYLRDLMADTPPTPRGPKRWPATSSPG